MREIRTNYPDCRRCDLFDGWNRREFEGANCLLLGKPDNGSCAGHRVAIIMTESEYLSLLNAARVKTKENGGAVNETNKKRKRHFVKSGKSG